ncbi:hypothetical protein M3Y98_01187900 [Aphelenchoides besseyi]|nr:hypothetical protein M3Y98_01187900 [Aphelenchoides besseyi]KAI6195268.1 hypothetical protein M3Y96_01212800 [Aphelenchoides besseyi]
MHIFYFIKIQEFETIFCGFRLSNRVLCTIFALCQLLVSIASFLQHIYSWIAFRTVFHCRSNVATNATLGTRFLANDIVIFDFGLMHRILGTTECVANYLDGGYMRCSWCIQHTVAMIILLACLACIPRPAWLLWPALFMQSTYVLGMAILSMAIAPKMLDALTGVVDHELSIAIGAYCVGVSFNWLFTFILWHYYWGVELRQDQLQAVRAA